MINAMKEKSALPGESIMGSLVLIYGIFRKSVLSEVMKDQQKLPTKGNYLQKAV